MSHLGCSGHVLNEDGDRVCECGDEGRMCEPCRQYEASYWESQWRASTLSERDPEAYEQLMRDAGRGHLVKGN